MFYNIWGVVGFRMYVLYLAYVPNTVHTYGIQPPKNIIKHIIEQLKTTVSLENIVGNISCEDNTEMTSPFRLDTITL